MKPKKTAASSASGGAAPKRHKTTGDTDHPHVPSAASESNDELFAVLPQSLQKLILSYACVAYKLFPEELANVRYCMPQLLAVNKAWNRAVNAMDDEFYEALVTIRIQTGLSEELSAVYEFLEADMSIKIQSVLVWFGISERVQGYMNAASKSALENIEKMDVDWQRVFASSPQLVRLDLTLVPLNSQHLCKILDAVSTHCRGLQVLILPSDEDAFSQEEHRPDFDRIMQQLFQALARWYKSQGPSGGLIQLSAPKRYLRESDDEQDVLRLDDFFSHVARYCPNIQHLTGCRPLGVDGFDQLGSNNWLCSLDEWRSFCRTCTRLREFYWFHAPFDDALLQIFGAYPKPNLKKMVFVVGNSFTDDRIERAFVLREFHRHGEIQFSSNGLAKAIAACPALEELHFWIGGGEVYHSWKLQNETTDEVLLAAASNCPGLRKLIILDSDGERPSTPLEGVSDAGLITISKLPKLDHIALMNLKASAQGILALIVNAPDPKRKRRVVVEIGCFEGHYRVCFVAELIKLMEFFVQLPATSLKGHRFELELRMKMFDDDKIREANNMHEQLCILRGKVMARHPHVAVLFCNWSRSGAAVPPADLRDLTYAFFTSPRGLTRSDECSAFC